VTAQLRPAPPYDAGPEAAALGAHAMIDVSDGLALDVHRLADASGVGFALDDVPVAAGATLDEALGGGEDYELLIAVGPAELDDLRAAFEADGLRELVRLGELIDWQRLEAHFAPYYREAGRPGLPIRLVVGLHLLKHIEGLSDEAVCQRWERDPYMQYFCGEEYFQHAFPLERSGMTHFRKRVGDEALETLLQETLAAAYRGGALSVRATEAVAVDTTVQEKAIAHPTEHGLLLTAIEQLGRHARKTGLRSDGAGVPRQAEASARRKYSASLVSRARTLSTLAI